MYIRRIALIASLVLQFPLLSAAESWQRERERAISERLGTNNGIVVGSPKIYDNSLLQAMLIDAQNRLAALQTFDASSIKFGNIQGARQDISSFAVSLQGPPSPGVSSTLTGASRSVTASDTDGNSSTFTSPSRSTTTTSGGISAPAATPPGATTALPSSFGDSASGILNEQVQLTYEIANLRLLLGGSLSDRLLTTSTGIPASRARTTVGFAIALTPDCRYKDAVAVVEIEAETSPLADLNGEAPAITALLPREKTYNVAAITDHSGSIGGGLVTQVGAVGGSYMFGRKTYYIVKDQDTLALTFIPETNCRTGFSWQYKPVLGEHYVKSGLKQNFVQLAFPSPGAAPSYGNVYIRTYWRRFDAKTGLPGEVIKGSLCECTAPCQLDNFDMAQNVDDFSPDSLEDLGNGQMLVSLRREYLEGTYVRIGSTILQPGSPGFQAAYSVIRFVAPIADLATKKVYLVSRDGSENQLQLKFYTREISKAKKRRIQLSEGNPAGADHSKTDKSAVESAGLRIPEFQSVTPTVTPIDETSSLLRVVVHFKTLLGEKNKKSPLVMWIGGKVFGYSDAPVVYEPSNGIPNACNDLTISIVLPTSFLVANPAVTVGYLMYAKPESVTELIYTSPGSEVDRLILVGQDANKYKFVLIGHDLSDVTAISSDVDVTQLAKPDPSIANVSIPKDLAKVLKQVVLRRGNGRPFLVTLPAIAAPDKPKQDLKFDAPVAVNSDEAVIVGDDIGLISKVNKVGVTNKPKDGKLKVGGLASLTGKAGTIEVEVELSLGTKQPNLKLEIVNSRVESVTK